MQDNPFNPATIVKQVLRHRHLIWQLTKRQVIGRYKGSYLGIAWSFLYPLLMLVAYTFIFSVVFKARWSVSPDESKVEFALTLFCGLIAYQLFSENVTRAPGLILENPNYVKKVIFPLEILPLTVLGASLIHSLISVGILLLGAALLMGKLSATLFYLPLVFMPLLFLSLGLSWILASLGTFIRDLQQLVSVVVQLLLFMSPIFYPVTALPEAFRPWMLANPLSSMIENFRRVLLWNMPPDWHWWAWGTLLTALFALGGYWWFKKTEKAFADVI